MTQMKKQVIGFESTFANMGRGVAGFFIGGAALRGATRLVDASIGISNALKIAGLEGENLKAVYDGLFASAQRNAAPIESLVQLYSRASQSAADLGASQADLLKFVDGVAVSLRVSGKSAEEASGALLQLGQALGNGRVQAEEYNSLLDGAYPLLQAVAAGLTEAGGSVGTLTRLVKDGKVSSKAFFDAFQAGSVVLEDKVAGAEVTVSSAFVRLGNVLIDTAGKFNSTSGAGQRFANFLDVLGTKITDMVNSPGFDSALNDLGDEMQATFARDMRDIQRVIALAEELAAKFDRYGEAVSDSTIALAESEQALANFAGHTAGKMGEVDAAAQDLFQQVLEGKGTAEKAAEAIAALGDANPDFAPLLTKIGAVIQRIYALRGAAIAATKPDVSGLPMSYAGQDAAPPKPSVPVKPVTLADYPLTGTGSGGRSSATSEIDRQKKAVTDLIDRLRFEHSIIGMSATAQAKANALREAGAAATAEQQAEITSLIDATAAEQASIDALSSTFDALADIGRSAIDGIISALDDGKVSAEEFGSILSDILGKAGSFFLNAAFSGIGGAFGLPGFADGGRTGRITFSGNCEVLP
ncbi:hypothetical protein ASD04_00100 [Devosia sp. Root436]|nr:hypothetical protein ASD04_00100 [Devosia sp. Root436]